MEIYLDMERVDEEVVSDVLEVFAELADECFDEGVTPEEMLVSLGRLAQALAMSMGEDIIH